MNGLVYGSLGPSLAAFLLAAALGANAHAAGVTVSIQYAGEAEREFADRLVSELSSEGYLVESRAGDEPAPCDRNGARPVFVATGAKAWIRIGSSGDSVVATICYLGALPFLQQASSNAPRSDPRNLALGAVEALNGLRSKVPPLAPELDPAAERAGPPAGPDATPSPRTDVSAPANSVALAGAVVFNAPDVSAAAAVSGAASLGMTRSVALLVDALWPVGGSELESEQVTATVRTAWLRIGPRLRWAAGDFEFSGAALAGPALSWATASARAPRVGAADITAGAVLSLKALVEYPRHASIFALASASASALVPGVRVDLGASEAVGAVPIEASVGLGARWGGSR